MEEEIEKQKATMQKELLDHKLQLEQEALSKIQEEKEKLERELQAKTAAADSAAEVTTSTICDLKVFSTQLELTLSLSFETLKT